MPDPSNTAACSVCVDMGTTNTRVWLVRGTEVLARAQAGVGVRDTARDGSPTRIRAALRDLILEVRKLGRSAGHTAEPSYVAAAGMITSPLGLTEVPHVSAPAGAAELSGATRPHSFPEVSELPFMMAPGVRCGPRTGTLETISQIDVMRGEETLAVGLTAENIVKPPATLLNLGSHWKAIRIDELGRIESSVTSISGELIHATQTQTILASAVPHERPAQIDLQWCEAGINEQRRSGLARALFCVRLLEMNSNSTAEQRLSFLAGVFIAADLDPLIARGMFVAGRSVLIAGGGAIAEAWQHALQAINVPSTRLADSEIERALLAGLRTILELAHKK
ncbi:MAG: 2-dehydro-3-deoxygalactonokinase [Verrucomicrobia bacterium]|nr:2-dehydro-3-deoxygalactonokinase [Verrucomicrobiota bacterium]